MSDLVRSIIAKNFLGAEKALKESLSTKQEKRLVEERKIIGAKIDEGRVLNTKSRGGPSSGGSAAVKDLNRSNYAKAASFPFGGFPAKKKDDDEKDEKKEVKEEQLQELSKKTLQSYLDKSENEDRIGADQLKMKFVKKHRKGPQWPGSLGAYTKKYAKAVRKDYNRSEGQDRANDRLPDDDKYGYRGDRKLNKFVTYKDSMKEENLQEVSIKKAIETYRERYSSGQDFYGGLEEPAKANKTLKYIEKKFGKKIANHAIDAGQIDTIGKKGIRKKYNALDYLESKEGVYTGSYGRKPFSKPNTKKGLKQRLDYMKLNKGSLSEENLQEISNRLLSRFIGKSLKQANDADKEYKRRDTPPQYNDKMLMKKQKRLAGVDKALAYIEAGKMEEENLQEKLGSIGPKFSTRAGTKPKKKLVVKKKKSSATPPWTGKNFKGHGKFKE